MLFFEFSLSFTWKPTRRSTSKILVIQTCGLKIMNYIGLGVLLLTVLIKGLTLILFILSGDLNSQLLQIFAHTPKGNTQDEKKKSIFNELLYTIIFEAACTFLMAGAVKAYRDQVLSVRDVYFYKNRMVTLLSPRNSAWTLSHLSLRSVSLFL
jgi:hypothetical protein